MESYRLQSSRNSEDSNDSNDKKEEFYKKLEFFKKMIRKEGGAEQTVFNRNGRESSKVKRNTINNNLEDESKISMGQAKPSIINSSYNISDKYTGESTIIHPEPDQFKCSSDISKSTHIHTSEGAAEQLPEPQIQLEIDSPHNSSMEINYSKIDSAEQSARDNSTDASEIHQEQKDIVVGPCAKNGAENPISDSESGECTLWPKHLHEEGNYIEGSSDNDRIDSTDAEKNSKLNNRDSLEGFAKQKGCLEAKLAIDHSAIAEPEAAESGSELLDKGDIESRGESEYSTHKDFISAGGAGRVFRETHLGARRVKTDSAVASPEGRDFETFCSDEDLKEISTTSPEELALTELEPIPGQADNSEIIEKDKISSSSRISASLVALAKTQEEEGVNNLNQINNGTAKRISPSLATVTGGDDRETQSSGHQEEDKGLVVLSDVSLAPDSDPLLTSGDNAQKLRKKGGEISSSSNKAVQTRLKRDNCTSSGQNCEIKTQSEAMHSEAKGTQAAPVELAKHAIKQRREKKAGAATKKEKPHEPTSKEPSSWPKDNNEEDCEEPPARSAAAPNQEEVERVRIRSKHVRGVKRSGEAPGDARKRREQKLAKIKSRPIDEPDKKKQRRDGAKRSLKHRSNNNNDKKGNEQHELPASVSIASAARIGTSKSSREGCARRNKSRSDAASSHGDAKRHDSLQPQRQHLSGEKAPVAIDRFAKLLPARMSGMQRDDANRLDTPAAEPGCNQKDRRLKRHSKVRKRTDKQIKRDKLLSKIFEDNQATLKPDVNSNRISRTNTLHLLKPFEDDQLLMPNEISQDSDPNPRANLNVSIDSKNTEISASVDGSDKFFDETKLEIDASNDRDSLYHTLMSEQKSKKDSSALMTNNNENLKFDDYGFLVEESRRNPIYMKMDIEKDRKLDKLIKHKKISHKQKVSLHKLLMSGINMHSRCSFWYKISNAKCLIDKDPSFFKDIEKVTLDFNTGDIILRDLHRQYPTHVLYYCKNNDKSKMTQGHKMLFKVLKAISLYDLKAGYCQAHAPIASILLMHMNAEQAFWILAVICTVILPPDYYSSLDGFLLDSQVFKIGLKMYASKAVKLLNQLNLSIYFLTEWFMCAFTRTFEFKYSMIVFDLFLLDGVKILFNIGYALLEEIALLEINDEDDFASTLSQIKINTNIINFNRMLKNALASSLTNSRIERIRKLVRKTFEASNCLI